MAVIYEYYNGWSLETYCGANYLKYKQDILNMWYKITLIIINITWVFSANKTAILVFIAF